MTTNFRGDMLETDQESAGGAMLPFPNDWSLFDASPGQWLFTVEGKSDQNPLDHPLVISAQVSPNYSPGAACNLSRAS